MKGKERVYDKRQMNISMHPRMRELIENIRTERGPRFSNSDIVREALTHYLRRKKMITAEEAEQMK